MNSDPFEISRWILISGSLSNPIVRRQSILFVVLVDMRDGKKYCEPARSQEEVGARPMEMKKEQISSRSYHGHVHFAKKVNPMKSTTFILFDKYYPIVDQLGSKDSSRDFQLNCVISFFLSTFNTPCKQLKIDVMEKE